MAVLLLGDDTLDGGLGADTLNGGFGNDTYVIDNVGDMINENSNAGTDSVQSSISHSLSANVENITLTGSSYQCYRKRPSKYFNWKYRN